MMKELYVFSGLGADERVFQKIDFASYAVTFIRWIKPNVSETIEQYASRLLVQVKANNPMLVGVSFGGMMAIEVAKQLPTAKVIIISSAKTTREIPFYYRMAGSLGLPKLLPAALLKSSNFFTDWYFGANTTFEKQLLKAILLDTDIHFLRWAINQIVHWKNEALPQQLFHIHGTADKVLPYRFSNSHVKLEKGGHLMVLAHAEAVSRMLKKIIESPSFADYMSSRAEMKNK